MLCGKCKGEKRISTREVKRCKICMKEISTDRDEKTLCEDCSERTDKCTWCGEHEFVACCGSD